MYTRLLAHLVLFTTLLTACGTSEAPHGATPGGAPADPHAAHPPGGHPPAAAPSAAPAGATLDLSGSIAFPGEFKASAMWVSVKDPANPGPPLAAKQLPAGPFPMTFTLTQADVVQMGPTPRPIPATVALTVRLDMDGNAMSKDPSEPIATLETPATSSGLSLTLAPAAEAPVPAGH